MNCLRTLDVSQFNIIVGTYLWSPNFIPLFYVSNLMPVPLCLDHWSL